MKNTYIQDESGDKKYFTVIPNYILNHSTLWDREVYIQMKRITGEGGTCWTSRKTLAKQCGISERRLDKSLGYLIEHNWIEYIGKKEVLTKGGIQPVNEYRVCDLWNKNNEFFQEKYRKGVAQDTTPKYEGVAQNTQRGSTDEAKGVAPGAYKEEPEENKNHINNNNNPLTPLKGENKQIAELINLFKEVNPSYGEFFKRKSQRAAIERMLQTIGYEKLHSAITVLRKTNGEEYAPTITSPVQLEMKLAALEAFLRKRKNKKSLIIEI